jgi:putative spermidine/putrescine transport system permease protein
MSLLFYLAVGLVYGFLLLPVIMTAWSSVATSPILTFPPRGFTFDWYQAIPSEFMTALKVSLQVGCVTTALATLVGVPAALAIARGRFPGRGLINLFCLSPLMVPTLVIGVASFQFWIRSTDVLGVNLGGTLWGIALGQAAFTVPYVIRTTLAGHANFDWSLEEAALGLGASPARVFSRVTLPMLMPGITSGAIFAFLMSLDDVPVALFMGGGAATTLPVKIFTSIQFSLAPYVMAVATILMAMSLVLMLVLGRSLGLDKFFGIGRIAK